MRVRPHQFTSQTGGRSLMTELQIAIDKYLKYLENIESASPHTLRAYQLDLDQVFANILDTKLNKELLTQIRIAQSKWGKLSLATRNRKAACMKSFLGWLYREQMIDQDYSQSVICPAVPKKIPHFISVDEVLAVISLLKNETLNQAPSPNLSSAENTQTEKINPLTKLLFYLLYGGALRVSEACRLQWEHIHSATRTIRLLGKGNKERIVVLPAIVIKLLQQTKTNFPQNNPYVFGEKPLNPRTAYEMIRQLGKKANLTKNLHPHALRHSYATHMLNNGTNLRIIQEVLGHESLQATEKYTHLGIDQLAQTMNAKHPLAKIK